MTTASPTDGRPSDITVSGGVLSEGEDEGGGIMGDMQAMAYGEAVYEGSIQLEVALSAHFASNHYPPLPQVLVPIAIEAIDHANAGEWDDRLDLPAGITWKGQDTAPVAACIEAWHLEWFLDQGAEF